MATNILTHSSATPAAEPANLQQGELAVNTADGKLWVGDGTATPVPLVTIGSPDIQQPVITWGHVSDAGAILGGVDYTVNKTGVGAYQMTFDKAASSQVNQSIVAVAETIFDVQTSVVLVSATVCQVSTYSSASALADFPFCFQRMCF